MPSSKPTELHKTLMRLALDTAAEGMKFGEVPIGAALARGDGTVLATAYNQMGRTRDKIAHAEIECFHLAAGKYPLACDDLVLASTLEPCVMCTGACMVANVACVVYGLSAPADGGMQRIKPPDSPEAGVPDTVSGVFADEAFDLLKQWLAANHANPQSAYVKQLIELHEGD